MRRYTNLTDRQRQLINAVARISRQGGQDELRLFQYANGAGTMGVTCGEQHAELTGWPQGRAVFELLAAAGFWQFEARDANHLSLALTQQVFDYADYAARPRVIRFWLDRYADLTDDKPLWPRVVYWLVGCLMGIAMLYLYQRLGLAP